MCGIASINGEHFTADVAKCVVMSYDYLVLAGTQGHFNHTKADRMIAIAEKQALPVVWFCEGGGGRPGDVDVGLISQGGLVCSTFYHFGRLSGLVPLVGQC